MYLLAIESSQRPEIHSHIVHKSDIIACCKVTSKIFPIRDSKSWLIASCLQRPVSLCIVSL